MSVHEKVAAVDLFSDLTPTELDAIVHRGTKFKRGAGAKLVEEGATDAGLQLIVSGSASVTVGGQPVSELSEGDYFGEISLLDGRPRSATVVAGPDGAETFAISSIAFSDLLDEHPDIARAMLRALTARIRKIEARQG